MTEPMTFAEAVASAPPTIVDLPADHPMARRVDSLARVADRMTGIDRAFRHAAEIDRNVRATARAMGIDPGGYVVLDRGSPEYARAERDLMRARAL